MNRSVMVRSELKKPEYIERDVVIDDIGELFTICYETLPNEYGHHFIVEKELQIHLDFVRNLTAANVKPIVQGKWEKGRQRGILGNEYKCSFCSYQIIMEEKDKYNYCPNCGADMRETDNG